MKKIILVFLLCCGVGLHAQEPEILFVTTIGGEVDKILLSHKPQISHTKTIYDSWTVTITETVTENYTMEYGYPIEIIKDYTFSDGTDGIEQPLKGNLRYTFSHHDGKVFIDGLNDSEQIKIYTIDGKEYKVPISLKNGHVEIPFSSTPKGVYLVKITNKQTFKIYIK